MSKRKDQDKKIEKAARAGYRKLLDGKPASVDSGSDDSEVQHSDQVKGSSTYEKDASR